MISDEESFSKKVKDLLGGVIGISISLIADILCSIPFMKFGQDYFIAYSIRIIIDIIIFIESIFAYKLIKQKKLYGTSLELWFGILMITYSFHSLLNNTENNVFTIILSVIFFLWGISAVDNSNKFRYYIQLNNYLNSKK